MHLLQELCLKQPLHRKKLQLALQALGDGAENDLSGKLDHNWVTSKDDTMRQNAAQAEQRSKVALLCCRVAG